MECKSYFGLSPPKGRILESSLVARINIWKNKAIKMVHKSMKILRGLSALHHQHQHHPCYLLDGYHFDVLRPLHHFKHPFLK